MPTLDPNERRTHFEEVACGFTLELAQLEAGRCLDCKHPRCVEACPVEVDIPAFIHSILNGDMESAYFTIYQDNILPSICGRVCPQESQCEGACVIGIQGDPVAIGALERFIGDYGLNYDLSPTDVAPYNGHKVAVVGSGPAGLANAASMRRLGYEVTIYEALHEFGGVLRYGIPDFRLPKDIVETEIARLKDMGIQFEKNVLIGPSITIPQLFEEWHYDAVFLGTGAGLPMALGIPGENHSGVYYANEFLTRVNLMRAASFPTYPTPVRIGNRVAVIGGGNVAMDAARTAKRLGAENVFILYRRDMESLPARQEEIEHAIEEGIEFRLTRNPVAFLGENYTLEQVKCEEMELGEPDSSGRRRPMPTGRFETFDVDSCIVAIGQQPNPIVRRATPGLETNKWGCIVTNNHQTNIPGVFAGGDVVSGAATVILAMGAGKDASIAMDAYIRAKSVDNPNN
jgi:glutamate synthase (NADPH/NADH) small chain